MANPISQISIEEICKQIHGSLGNSSLLVQVFACQLTPHECQRTREKYMEMYGEDLFDRLQNKIYGHTSRACTILSLLMLNPHERDAIVAQKAILRTRMVSTTRP
ncbi:putative Annexin superfamily [Helianthus annuus]|nr:putative Annexin superfamily [Helianthus annuus]